MDNYKDAIVRYAEQKQIDKHTYIKSRLNHASNFFAIPITEELLKTYESVSLMDILFIIQCEKITIEEFYAFLLPEDYRPDCSDTDYHYDYRVNGVRLPRRKPIIQLKDFGNNFAAPPVIDKKSLKPIPEPKYRKHFGELILPYFL